MPLIIIRKREGDYCTERMSPADYTTYKAVLGWKKAGMWRRVKLFVDVQRQREKRRERRAEKRGFWATIRAPKRVRVRFGR